MISTCLFDLDGTLLDTLATIRYYVNLAAERHGLCGIDLDETKIMVGGGAKSLIKNLLRKNGIDPETSENEKFSLQILEDYLKAYDSDPYYLTEPYDGIPELLEYLVGKGIKVGVISNKPKSTVALLCDRFFKDIFFAVEGGRDDFPLKPDPTLAFDMLKRIGASASDTAYFGDTGTDMKTGKAIGAAVNCGVLWGFREREELCASGASVTVIRPNDIKSFI